MQPSSGRLFAHPDTIHADPQEFVCFGPSFRSGIELTGFSFYSFSALFPARHFRLRNYRLRRTPLRMVWDGIRLIGSSRTRTVSSGFVLPKVCRASTVTSSPITQPRMG